MDIHFNFLDDYGETNILIPLENRLTLRRLLYAYDQNNNEITNILLPYCVFSDTFFNAQITPLFFNRHKITVISTDNFGKYRNIVFQENDIISI